MGFTWFGSCPTASASTPIACGSVRRTWRPAHRGVIAVVMLAAMVTRAAAQDAPVDGDLLSWVQPESPGCVVAVSHRTRAAHQPAYVSPSRRRYDTRQTAVGRIRSSDSSAR